MWTEDGTYAADEHHGTHAGPFLGITTTRSSTNLGGRLGGILRPLAAVLARGAPRSLRAVHADLASMLR
jgi:hypothetical protein